jgi:recombination protein RecR
MISDGLHSGSRTAVRELVEEFKKFPGISLRSAQRLAYSLLNDEALKKSLEKMLALARSVEVCKSCGCFREVGGRCENCEDTGRTICVVANISDMTAIKRVGCFDGSFHILGGLIAPLENSLPENLRIDELKRRAEADPGVEVLLALPFSIEGDATALYIKDVLNSCNVKLSRIARGLPAGTAPDVVDHRTVSEAFSGKTIY